MPLLKISRFTEIVLDRERNEEYSFFRVEEDPARPTLLHLAVEHNFFRVAKLLVEKYPSLVYSETRQVGDKGGYLSVEKALMMYYDETAAYLISRMEPYRWVTKYHYVQSYCAGFNSQTCRLMWIEFVASLLCTKRISPLLNNYHLT